MSTSAGVLRLPLGATVTRRQSHVTARPLLKSTNRWRTGRGVHTFGRPVMLHSFGRCRRGLQPRRRRSPPCRPTHGTALARGTDGTAPAPPQRAASCVSQSPRAALDRKSTRLNSSHVAISYAVFCL